MKKLNNQQFVRQVMSKGSPLREAFVIEAIRKYCECILKMDPNEEEDSGNWTLLSPHAWREIAQEINQELKDQYG